MAVITIAHQLGSSGREIGQGLAQHLGFDYVDRQIVAGVAQKLGISEQLAADMDERAQGVVMRLLSTFNMGSAMLIAPTYDMGELPPDEREYHEATLKTIQAAATSNRAVIAGHGANMALAGKPGVLHVYIYAPLEQRIETLMTRDKIGHDEATRQIHDSDQARSNYVKTFYNSNWHNPLNYHLMLNTAMFKPNQAVEVIEQAVKDARL